MSKLNPTINVQTRSSGVVYDIDQLSEKCQEFCASFEAEGREDKGCVMQHAAIYLDSAKILVEKAISEMRTLNDQ